MRRVSGVEEAKDVAGIEDVQITARLDQSLVPLPEGDAYLGFIFAKGAVARPGRRIIAAGAQLPAV